MVIGLAKESVAKIDRIKSPPEVVMMQQARSESLIGQIREARKRDLKIKETNLGGGVVIWGALEANGVVPIISLGGLPPEIEGVSEAVELDQIERKNVLFLNEELGIPMVAAMVEVWGGASQEIEWQQKMVEIYGRPEAGTGVPAVVALTGMPEQYKSFLALYLVSKGEALISLDPFSKDNLPEYLRQVGNLSDKSIEELVKEVAFTTNDQTRPGNEYWKVNIDGKDFWIKKQHYLYPGMKDEPINKVIEVKVGEGGVEIGDEIKIGRQSQIIEERFSAREQLVNEFRRVMANGVRPEVIFADTAGYWLREGNIYDLVALESMTALVTQRVQFQMKNEWQVRDDDMNLTTLYDYIYFMARNKDKLVELDKIRSEMVMSGLKGDTEEIKNQRNLFLDKEQSLTLKDGLVTRQRYLEAKLKALAEWGVRADVGDVSSLASGIKEAMTGFAPNGWQLQMARILGNSEFGEVIGTTSYDGEMAVEIRKMMENGCLFFPRMVNGSYVMVDKEGVFLVKYKGDDPFENIISPGRQSEKVLIELFSNETKISLRDKEVWHKYRDEVEITEVGDEAGMELISKAWEQVKVDPFFTMSDYRWMESVGMFGRMSLIPGSV